MESFSELLFQITKLKQELAFIVVYEILMKETLGSKSILRTFEHYQLTLITGVLSEFLAATFFITRLSLTP